MTKSAGQNSRRQPFVIKSPMRQPKRDPGNFRYEDTDCPLRSTFELHMLRDVKKRNSPAIMQVISCI
jgi:hypothetical protein